MRNLIKVLTVLGWCLFGMVIGVAVVQAGTGNGSGADNTSSIANLLTSTGVGDSLIVTTASITSITTTTASSGGSVSVVGEATVYIRGVCWSTSANPTTDNSNTTNGSGAGSFTSSFTGLTPGTLYHVRAYAVYIEEPAKSMFTYYGGDSTFTTLTTPTVTTTTITSITSTTASGGGNVTADGGDSVTARGVCWSTSANPTTDDSKTTNGSDTGVFTSSLTSLTPGTLYHVRAYATNSVSTSYGGDSSFTTLTTPTVTTATITSITATTASGGGNVTSGGGATVTARGVCWSTSANPTTSDSKTTNGTGTGTFTSSLTSLTPTTLYHVRAYATNSVGTSYGGDSTFTTINIPTVTTTAITSITSTTASSGGNVTSSGGATVTARGVCWSTSTNPTVADSHTTNGTGTGTFTSSITGLDPDTTYHVRAYATNSAGTGYGSQVSFTTLRAHTISGYVLTSDSAGIDDVVLDGLPGDPLTDTDGYYTSMVDSGWSGTVKPTLENYAFDPESTIYSDIAGDQETDYTGTFIKLIISGHVRHGGEGVGGVVMNGLPGDPETDTTGYYRAIVDTGTYWTVIPTADGCTFQPEDRIYVAVSSDHIDQDYTETCFSEGIDPDKDNSVPKEYQLSYNQPNPFNPTTEIRFGLPRNSHVALKIYNVVGQEVITLIDRDLSAGTYQVRWNGLDNSGRTVSSGVYFYRIRAGDYVQTRQMLLLK